MRLRVHAATANEELVALVNEGYDALSAIQADYQRRKDKGTHDDLKDVDPEVAPMDACALRRCRYFVRGLNRQCVQSLPEYTDLPLGARLYVEDIGSVRKVRDVNPGTVLDVLKNGYLDRSEDSIQTALERMLSIPFHKKDWGGEQNDLYTANLLVNGIRHETGATSSTGRSLPRRRA